MRSHQIASNVESLCLVESQCKVAVCCLKYLNAASFYNSVGIACVLVMHWIQFPANMCEYT